MASRFVRFYSASAAALPKLANKVAIVTASTDGIGFGIARRLGQDGAKVVICSRKAERVNNAVEQLRNEKLDVYGTVCHVGKAEDRVRLVNEALKQFGGIDILISNAAANPTFGPMFETNEEIWDKIFDTNVKAAFFLCKEAVPHIAKRGGGSVVFVSSIAAYNMFEGLGTYCVSKVALAGLCKALTSQCASMNVRVNCLAPGVIRTKFSQALVSNPQSILQAIPLRRLGTPDECASTVSFLASDDARYITGETIVVGGGMQSRL